MDGVGYGTPIWHYKEKIIRVKMGSFGFFYNHWEAVGINFTCGEGQGDRITDVSPDYRPFPNDDTTVKKSPFTLGNLFSPQGTPILIYDRDMSRIESPNQYVSCVLCYQEQPQDDTFDLGIIYRRYSEATMGTQAMMTSADCASTSAITYLSRADQTDDLYFSEWQWSLQFKERAAFHYLPKGAILHEYIVSPELRQFLETNWDSLHAFVYNELLIKFPKENFCVVLGYVKTPQFASVSFKGTGLVDIRVENSDYVSLEVDCKSGEVRHEYRAEPTPRGALHRRVGDKYGSKAVDDEQYVVFANLGQVKKRLPFIRPKLKASAYPPSPRYGGADKQTPAVATESSNGNIEMYPDQVCQIIAICSYLNKLTNHKLAIYAPPSIARLYFGGARRIFCVACEYAKNDIQSLNARSAFACDLDVLSLCLVSCHGCGGVYF